MTMSLSCIKTMFAGWSTLNNQVDQLTVCFKVMYTDLKGSDGMVNRLMV